MSRVRTSYPVSYPQLSASSFHDSNGLGLRFFATHGYCEINGEDKCC